VLDELSGQAHETGGNLMSQISGLKVSRARVGRAICVQSVIPVLLVLPAIREGTIIARFRSSRADGVRGKIL
jgi:hypothetical protein